MRWVQAGVVDRDVPNNSREKVGRGWEGSWGICFLAAFRWAIASAPLSGIPSRGSFINGNNRPIPGYIWGHSRVCGLRAANQGTSKSGMTA